MNYLAHAFLSFNQEQVLVGNFIGDFVKGNSLDSYPEGIQTGVFLHRRIDAYTDSHPLVKAGQSYLKPKFGRYSTVITDIFFDYFLSKNWSKYSSEPIDAFIDRTYETVFKYRELLPERFLGMFEYMSQQNWLLQYGKIEGMQSSLTGLSKRTRFDSKMEEAHLYLQEFEDEFEIIFLAFFEDLKSFAARKLKEIELEYGCH